MTALILTFLAAAPVGTAKPPVVAVLYFDNDSGDSSLDVLQKGLADMLVTDLAASEQVEVVEREKLQQLIDELELQRTKYFDPKTALKLGRFAGATHAVTGSFHSFEPTLRVDVRLVEMASGKVVLAESVSGTKEKFFDLEQNLARRFLAKLDAQLSGAAKKTQGADFEAVLTYSKALAYRDEGALEEASRTLAEVARRSPQFTLANERQKDLLLALEQLAQRRNDALVGYSDELLKNADAYLATHDPAKLKNPASRVYLAYRLVRGAFALSLIESRLGRGTPRCTLDGRADEVTGLMKSYFANQELLDRELRVLPKGTTPSLPAGDLGRARALGIEELVVPDALDAARFVLEGRAGRWTVWPPLAQLDPKACDAAVAMVDRLAAERDGEAAIVALDLKARGLIAAGRVDEATATWRSVLERFPASPRYREVETRIKDLGGLSSAAKQRQEDQRWFDRARTACRQDELERAGPYLGKQRSVAEGLNGWRRTITELEQTCGSNPGLAPLYTAAARAAVAAGDCGTYEKVTARLERVDRSAAWTLKGELPCDDAPPH